MKAYAKLWSRDDGNPTWTSASSYNPLEAFVHGDCATDDVQTHARKKAQIGGPKHHVQTTVSSPNSP